VAPDEVLVVSQAFIEFTRDGMRDCWRSLEDYGVAVPTSRDATLELLRLVDDTVDDLARPPVLGGRSPAGIGPAIATA
jgi:hypothetical protein